MQEYLEEKSIALIIKGSKLTAALFKKIVQAAVKLIKACCAKRKAAKSKQPESKSPRSGQQEKAPPGTRDLGERAAEDLFGERAHISQVPNEACDLGRFPQIAHHYGIEYSVCQDKDPENPRFFVFVKAKTESDLLRAFEEFTHEERETRPSVAATLQRLQEEARATPEKIRNKVPER